MKSLAMVLLAATVLTGCGNPFGSAETRACEAFIKGTITSPATYKRAAVHAFDSGITKAALKSEYGPEGFDYLPDQGLEVREVFIEFDMANAFGTPIRQAGTCKFLLADKRLVSTGTALDSTVSAAIARAALLNAAAAGAIEGVRPAAGAVAECCIR